MSPLKLPSGQYILKCLELFLALLVLLFTQFGGVIHLGSDPPPENWDKIGLIPYGSNYIQEAFGSLIVNGYAFILTVQLISILFGEKPFLANLIFDSFGFIGYLAVACLQFIALSDPETFLVDHAKRGFSLSKEILPFALFQAIAALLISFLLLVNVMNSIAEKVKNSRVSNEQDLEDMESDQIILEMEEEKD